MKTFVDLERLMQKGDVIQYRYRTGDSAPMTYNGRPFECQLKTNGSYWYAPIEQLTMALIAVNVFSLDKGAQIVPNLIVTRPGVGQIYPQPESENAHDPADMSANSNREVK